MTKDMTNGSPARLIITFTIPLILGNLFQQFYSMVDTMIVGRFLGKTSLAAVGSTGSLNFLIIGFCLGLCSGFAIPIAQQFGAKDYEILRRYVGNIVWLSIVSSVILTFLTVIFCRPMLIAMQTPADIIDEAYTYIVIIFAGIPATFFYNILASLLRSLGDSRTPVLFLVLASIINIGLDLLLILVIPMGVAGAAVATVVSQLVSGIACFLFIGKKFDILRISKQELSFRSLLSRRLLGTGVPMGLQFSITAVGSIILQASVNTLGSSIVASVTASNKIFLLFACVFDAMGVSIATYGGQNIGAGKINRLNPGLKAAMALGAGYSILSLVILIFIGRPLVYLFVDAAEVQIISDAYQFLITCAVFFVALAAVDVFRSLIQGMGYSKIAVFSGVFEMVARGITGLFLVPLLGFPAACFASPIAWIMADFFLIPIYFRLYHVLKNNRPAPPQE